MTPVALEDAATPGAIDVIGGMFRLMWYMIHSVPPITSATISVPKASARELFTLSGAVVRCRKKARCTPICATASTLSATGMLGSHSQLEPVK